MRALILLAAAALGLAACGKNDQAGNVAGTGDTLSPETISANDVTAIDAVTGEAANMAADVNYINEVDENGGANTATAKPSGNRSASKPAPATSTTNTAAPAATTATVNNSTE